MPPATWWPASARTWRRSRSWSPGRCARRRGDRRERAPPSPRDRELSRCCLHSSCSARPSRSTACRSRSRWSSATTWRRGSAAGCCYGKPTASAIGMRFPSSSVAYQTLKQTHPSLIVGDHTVALIPTQLIEALFELGLAGIFIAMLLRRARPGLVCGCYAVCYASFRFAVEYFRFDPERGYVIAGVLSTSQFLSIGLFGGGVWILWRAFRVSDRAAATRSSTAR
ncbi:MAG: prolipoprotein diacylglyceryl transferase [Deltaproteobacteria bacterium]|nr:prolipoprotein diacylglyceryl transferase [Deltaproteobacteria bacterium]